MTDRSLGRTGKAGQMDAGAVRTEHRGDGSRLRTLGLRWVHLLQGGAQLMPFFLLAVVALGVVRPDLGRAVVTRPLPQILAYALSLPPAAVFGLLPLVRSLESAAARTLCGLPGPRAHWPAVGPARSWAARRRSAAWFTLHVGLGALVSGASLAVPPMAVVLLVLPFAPALRTGNWAWPWDHAGDAVWTAPVAGAALLVLLAAAVHGAGTLLARCAPLLLGPTPADRLAAAERRAADLANRNRLARELHDSVGHALSAVALQAGAARRVLESDPAFVRQALAAIEETGRGAVAELDAVLGLLRSDGDDRHAGPTLATGLEALLARTRATGTEVVARTDPALGPLEALDGRVSAEAFRIVQEGLHNALRHAPGATVRLDLAEERGPEGRALRVTVQNTVDNAVPGPGPVRDAGGRGLAGITERAALLGGTASAGRAGGLWRLSARLPLPGAPPVRAKARKTRGATA